MFQFMLRTLLISVVCVSIPQTVTGQEKTSKTQDATAIEYQYTPRKGKRAPHPDFILPSIDSDNMIQLSNYRGKKVLLLHFASW
jgi:hypothetical protein